MRPSPAPPLIVEPRRGLFGWAAAVILLLATAGAVLFLYNPGQYGFYPFCLFHKATGLLCPGCGSLRALHHLLHGHLAEAFRLNALLVVSLPLWAWLGFRATMPLFGLTPPPLRVRVSYLGLGLFILIAFGVLRNVL